MLEQLKVFRAGSYEGVSELYNDWMIINLSKITKVVEIEHFTEWIPNNETLSENSRTDYLIRLRYETTLSKLNE